MSDTCHRGHLFDGTMQVSRGRVVRVCRICRNAASQARKHEKRIARYAATGLVPKGMSLRQVAMRVVWEGRRQKFGPTGLSPEGKQSLSDAIKHRLKENGHHASKKTHCPKGHPYDTTNTFVNSSGKRECRICRRLWRGARPVWVMVGSVKVSIRAHDAFYWREYRRLRAVMLAAHPDPGSANIGRREWKSRQKRFRIARDAFKQFIERERQWYVKVGLAPPMRTKRQVAA